MQGFKDVGRLPQDRPWKLLSQFYVAFIGGPLAYTGIAYLNAKRLGLSGARLWAIPTLGVAMTLISLTVMSYAQIADLDIDGSTDAPFGGFWVRLISRIIAVALFVVFARMQKSADRIYQINHAAHDDIYASLWVPGIVASVVLGFVQGILAWIIL